MYLFRDKTEMSSFLGLGDGSEMGDGSGEGSDYSWMPVFFFVLFCFLAGESEHICPKLRIVEIIAEFCQ